MKVSFAPNNEPDSVQLNRPLTKYLIATGFTAARCSTPVDVIKVSREDFNRYISSSPETKSTIKERWKARTLSQAKQLIRLQTNLTRKHLNAGDVVYREGDVSGYAVTECPIEEYILLTSASPFFQGR
jgi:hypothetical protein